VTFSARRLIAGVLAAGGLGLVMLGAGAAATAFRARQAFVSACDRIPPAATNGVWVRLQGCGISRADNVFLDDAKGWHLRRLMPVWRIAAESKDAKVSPAAQIPPARVVVAVPLASAADQEQLRIAAGSAPPASDGIAPFADTMGVVMGRIGANGYHVVDLARAGHEASVAENATIIDVVAPPTFRNAGLRALSGLALLALAWLAFTYELPASWGRILVFASAGMAAMLLGVRWYSTPWREATPTHGPATPTVAAAAAPKRDDRLDQLLPAIHTSNPETRRNALTALRSMNLPRIPPALIAEASGKGKNKSPFQREAFEAALVLGARRLNPELLIAGSRNSETSAMVLQELRTNTDDASARVLARIWVDGADVEFNRLAYVREKSSHDMSAALLEIVIDGTQPETRRTQAAHLLGTLNEVGALPPLRRFAMTLAPGVLKQSVDNTIDRLDVLSRQGRTPQMRAFESKTN
jgi:hypothetical protein